MEKRRSSVCVLGPVLFILFIADINKFIPLYIDRRYKIRADDQILAYWHIVGKSQPTTNFHKKSTRNR